VEEISLFNKLFPIVNTCLSCEDMARQICAMVRRWRIFGGFFCVLYFSEPRADLQSKFALRPHHVWKCVEVSNLQPLRIGEEKKKKKPHDENIMACPIGQS